MFLLAMFLTPSTRSCRSSCGAALVVVGALMIGQVREIDFTKFEVALPAFLTIMAMPFTYSIANGIGVGFITWVVLHAVSGKVRTIHPLLWVVAALFALYFSVDPLTELLT